MVAGQTEVSKAELGLSDRYSKESKVIGQRNRRLSFTRTLIADALTGLKLITYASTVAGPHWFVSW